MEKSEKFENETGSKLHPDTTISPPSSSADVLSENISSSSHSDKWLHLYKILSSRGQNLNSRFKHVSQNDKEMKQVERVEKLTRTSIPLH